MKIKLTVCGIAIGLLLSSCSSKQLYQQIQAQNKSRCKPELNRDAQAECQSGSNTGYRDYQRERETLLKRNDG